MADLPVRLEALVETTSEGLQFPVQVRNNEAFAGLTVVGVMGALFLYGFSILAIIAFPLCVLTFIAGTLIGIGAPLLGLKMKKKAMLEITPDGFRQHSFGGQTVTWKHVKKLKLRGDAKKGWVRLHADSFLLREWRAVKAASEDGWDADAIRGFTEHVAAMSGVELLDEMPETEAFAEKENERYERAFERRQKKRDQLEAKMETDFAELHGLPPKEAVLREVDGVQAYVLDRGQRQVRSKETSSTEDQPVLLKGESVCVGEREAKLSEIEAVSIVYAKLEEDGEEVQLWVELKNGKRWRVARRTREGLTAVKGVAEDLKARAAI